VAYTKQQMWQSIISLEQQRDNLIELINKRDELIKQLIENQKFNLSLIKDLFKLMPATQQQLVVDTMDVEPHSHGNNILGMLELELLIQQEEKKGGI
jgi:hypothetical protein